MNTGNGIMIKFVDSDMLYYVIGHEMSIDNKWYVILQPKDLMLSKIKVDWNFDGFEVPTRLDIIKYRMKRLGTTVEIKKYISKEL